MSIGLATNGYYGGFGGSSPPLPEVVYSPTGVPASDIDDQTNNFYGYDIWYDDPPNAQLGQAGYVVTASGDWAIATGLDALRQRLLRRLITAPGEWQTLPSFGVGAPQYVKGPLTSATLAELEGRIRQQFTADKGVASVSDVSVDTSTFDNSGNPIVIITVLIVAAGSLQSAAPIPISLAVPQ